MAAQRYEFNFQVVKLLLTQENEFDIFKPPSNLFSVIIDYLTVCTNDHEKAGNYVEAYQQDCTCSLRHISKTSLYGWYNTTQHNTLFAKHLVHMNDDAIA